MAEHPQQPTPRSHQVVKAATAATVSGGLLMLSSLTLVGTVVGLTISTPLLVIFSPVLVPAGIAIVLVIAGFLLSGSMGVAALSVFNWIYKYVTGKRPPGADQLERARMRLASKARDMKERAEQYGYQAQSRAQEAVQGS